jgi:hypothetical protein
MEVRFHLLPKRGVARFPSGEPVSRWLPKLLLGPVSQWLWHRSASAVPFVVAKVVPKNCYRYSSRRFCIGLVPHNRGCALPVHVHLRSHGDFLPKLPIFLWTGELLVPKVQIFFPISLALSPEFVTNTLLGLSRPVVGRRVSREGQVAFRVVSVGCERSRQTAGCSPSFDWRGQLKAI